MKYILFFLFYLTFFVAVKAQSNYTEAMQQGDRAFSSGQYKTAINKYFAAEAFDPGKKDVVREKVNRVFDRIEALRQEAVTAKKESDVQKQKVTKTRDAFRLILLAQEKVHEDPTIALQIADAALQKHQDTLITLAAREIYEQNDFYKKKTLTKFIRCVAISPDRTRILTGSDDNIARLWNINGSLIREFRGHRYPIMSVAFSPDGAKILTGGYDHIAVLWDTGGTTKKEYIGHKGPIMSVAFSPDGTKFLTGSIDQTARLWDTGSISPKEYLQEYSVEGGVYTLAFSKDRKKILTGTQRDTWIWNIDGSGKKESEVKVKSVSLSANGESIFSGYKKDTAGLFNFQGHLLMEFKQTPGNLISLAVSPAGDKILTGSDDGSVKLWDEDGYLKKVFKGHSRTILSIDFSNHGKTFFTCSRDSSIRYWTTDKTLEGEFKLQNNDQVITSLIFSPDGKKILTSSEDQLLKLWNIDGTFMHKFTETPDEISSIDFSPDGKSILIFSRDSITSLWSLTGNKIGHYSGSSFSFSPDGKSILTGSRDGVARLLGIDGKLLKEFKPPDTCIISVTAISPYDAKMLTGCNNSHISLWNKDGILKWRIKLNDSIPFSNKRGNGRVTSAVFSPDGKNIIVGLSVPHTRGFYTKTFLVNIKGDPIIEIKGTQFAFSPDGNKMLYLNGSTIMIINSNGDLISDYNIDGINSVTFTADAKKIITGTSDGIIRVWAKALSLEEFLRSNKIDKLSAEQEKQYGIK